jgi:hypothetical protein
MKTLQKKKFFAYLYLISISLKVVNIAHVFCASLRRSAIFKRIRDIFTRVSDRVPLILFGSSPLTWGLDVGVVDFCAGGVNLEDGLGEVELSDGFFDGSSFVCSASTLSVDLSESSLLFSVDLSFLSSN